MVRGVNGCPKTNGGRYVCMVIYSIVADSVGYQKDGGLNYD